MSLQNEDEILKVCSVNHGLISRPYFCLGTHNSTVALIPHSWPENVANGIDYHVTVIDVWAVQNIPVLTMMTYMCCFVYEALKPCNTLTSSKHIENA